VTAPDGTMALSRRRESEGKYSLTAHMDGIYSICFSNQMSRLTPKEVDVEISVTGANNGGSDDLAKKEHLDPLEQQILQLSAAISAVHNEQKYMKMRETRHRFTNDSTNSRVLWWSFFEATILIGASLFQVYYLRRFFEQKTSL
jgi:p24 family protein beta-1